MTAQAMESPISQAPRAAAFKPAPAAQPIEIPQALRPALKAPKVVATQAGPFVPLVLLVAAFLMWTIFQTVQLWKERSNLQAAHVSQKQLVENSQKLRGSLDAIAAGAARLAHQGNPSARALVEELAKRGITINPNGQAGVAGAAKPAK